MKKLILTLIIAVFFTLPVYADNRSTAERFYSGEKVGFMDLFYETAGKSNEISFFSNSPANSELYYDQLTDCEKNIYNFIETNINSTMNGTESLQLDFNFYIDTGLSNDQFLAAAVSKFESENNIDLVTAVTRPTYALLSLDKPEYFWIDLNKQAIQYWARYNRSSGYTTFSIEFGLKSNYTNYYPDCYTSSEQVITDYNNMLDKAYKIVSNIPKDSTDWGKVNYFTNWLNDNADYNHSSNASAMQYLPTSAFLYGKDTVNAPVCEGYAEALKILCNLSNVKCMCVEAIYELNGSMTGHKWNLINIDGSFYHCDPTWFDNYNNINSYRFLFTGSVNMAKYDTGLNHTIAYQRAFTAPNISESDYLSVFGINSYTLLNTDGNKTINKADIAKLLRIISGIDKDNAYDINGDGKKDINDVIKMQKLMFKQ